MLVLLLVLLAGVLVALGVSRLRAGTGADRARELTRPRPSRAQRRAARRERAHQRRLPPLPAQDAPPPGLVPLVPSPRAVHAEAARGIRELEDWLADQTSA